MILTCLSLTAPASAQDVRFERRHVATFEVQVLVPGPLSEPVTLDVDPAGGGEVAFEVPWAGSDRPMRVHLKAKQLSLPGDAEHLVTVSAVVEDGRGRKVRSERPVRFVERTTVLFEVYRDADRPLTLALAGSSEVRTWVPRHPSPGAPVRLRVEIRRVEDGRSVPLENNVLQTFVGESVSYSFDLGGGGDTVELRLLPLRVTGGVIEIDVDVTGSLPRDDPDAGGPDLVSRHERWAASRGSTSTLAIETGQPPTGWRFLVTPDF